MADTNQSNAHFNPSSYQKSGFSTEREIKTVASHLLQSQHPNEKPINDIYAKGT